MQSIAINKKPNGLILAIYILMLAFFIYKMIFYSLYVGRFPDEPIHISYIAYLESTNKLIPDFKDMKILTPANTLEENADFNYSAPQSFTGNTSYLGHPPLYYQIMRLAGGVKVQGGVITIDIMRLRSFSMALAALAMLLIFYIGYSRIGKGAVYHFLYAAVCISVPMLAYDCAGINNDTLALVGVSVSMLALLRFTERRRNLPTYWLIAAGLFISLLSKLTAGMIVVIALLLVSLVTAIRERSLKFLLCRNFLITLPLYLIAAGYFLLVYLQVGALQPSLQQVDPQQFYASVFYTEPAHRAVMTLKHYARYFFDSFFGTWCSIASHVSLPKGGRLYSLSKVGLAAIWFLPALAVFILRRHNRSVLPVLSVYIGVGLTSLFQFYQAYHQFHSVSGYLGGFQSRYYLCAITAFGLAIVWLAKAASGRPDQSVSEAAAKPGAISQVPVLFAKSRELIVKVACAAFSCLLIYEDFIYFVLNFKDYMHV